ncbi:MAG: FAD-binding protein [Clostridiaceae bacterium]|nr:FAD-binding protein [Clostridiaceae bacterium]
MKEMILDQTKIDEKTAEVLQKLCPFGAFSREDGKLSVNAGCRLCGLCVKKGPPGAVIIREKASEAKIDKSLWRGIAVLADTSEGVIHPVTFELLGKARELAAVIGHPVYALLIGCGNGPATQELLQYGADEVFVYDDPGLADFLIEPYAAAAADFIEKVRPTALLVGGTNAGRSLAPRVAARFRTGLTADCTALEMRPDTDLVQIRPAFGGNIMARILTCNSRPQLCTVRYKIFTAPRKQESAGGRVIPMILPPEQIAGRTALLASISKERGIDLTAADVIVAVGRGIKNKKDLEMIRELAGLLHAQVACTRPLVENGWFDPRLQIGLSGRTVSPKLIMTIGIAGSVQFVAGMKGSETIISINNDAEAGIFQVAHYAVIGDLYAIVPNLISRIKTHEPII